MHQLVQRRWQGKSRRRFHGIDQDHSRCWLLASCRSRRSTSSCIIYLHQCGATKSIPYLVSCYLPLSFWWLWHPLSRLPCFISSSHGKIIVGGGPPTSTEGWQVSLSTRILSTTTSIVVEWAESFKRRSISATWQSYPLLSSSCSEQLVSNSVWSLSNIFTLEWSVINQNCFNPSLTTF